MSAKKIISIILVVLWMSIIFLFSNQQGEGSGNMSREICEIIIDIIDVKNIDIHKKEATIQILEPIIRKLAHYIIYLMGGIVIANCVYQYCYDKITIVTISAIIGGLYAITDEVHQLMIIGRNGNVIDVIIDSLGIVTGTITFLLINQIIQKINSKKVINRG